MTEQISSGHYDEAGKVLAEYFEPTAKKANEAVAYFKKKKAELQMQENKYPDCFTSAKEQEIKVSGE